MEPMQITIGADRLRRLYERCWSAVSNLESQVVRNPSLPEAYKQVVSEAFQELRDLDEEISRQVEAQNSKGAT